MQNIFLQYFLILCLWLFFSFFHFLFWIFSQVPHLDITKVKCANDETRICFLDFVSGV